MREKSDYYDVVTDNLRDEDDNYKDLRIHYDKAIDSLREEVAWLRRNVEEIRAESKKPADTCKSCAGSGVLKLGTLGEIECYSCTQSDEVLS